jgi:hypothetical protein
MSNSELKEKLKKEYNKLIKELELYGGIVQNRLINIPQRSVSITYDNNKLREITFTIPKNTLLFRAVDNYKDDLFGIKQDDKLCIPYNYNVFFYFDPYTIDFIPKWYDNTKKIEVYVTNHDLLVFNLVTKYYNRGTRWSENAVIENCDIDKNACGNGRSYDPCLKKNFIDKNNDIYGYITMGRSDSKIFRDNIKNSKKNEIKNVHIIKSYNGEKGPAELALYPLKNRKSKDVYIDPNNQDKFLESNEYNYRHITTLIRNESIIKNFMEKHAADRPEGYFYTYK